MSQITMDVDGNDTAASTVSTSPVMSEIVPCKKASSIKKMLRTQKAFLEVFSRYRCEVRSLQAVVDARFKKIGQLEDRLTNLAHSMQCNSQAYTQRRAQIAQRNRKIISTFNNMVKISSNGFNSNKTLLGEMSNLVFASRFGTPETVTQENQIEQDLKQEEEDSSNLYFEPIVEIQENDDDQHKETIVSLEKFFQNSQSNVSETCTHMNGQVGESKANKRNSVSVTSKNEFLELLNQHKKNNNLAQQQVADNICALQTIDTSMIIGYKCSIKSCNYSHFLKAQVNRHFKNFHGKACSTCNMRKCSLVH